MTTYAYDVESFFDFFSAIFINVDNPTDQHIFINYRDRNDNAKLVGFLKQPDLTLVGHNSLYYDDLMLRAIQLYPKIDAEALGRLTKKLIEGERDERAEIPHYYELAYPKEPTWISIDTLALTRVNQTRVSLKYAAVVLRHYWIQDLPIPPGSKVLPEQVDDIIRYNINDVKITIKLYKELIPLIEMRRDVGAYFGVDVLTANDTEIAKQIIGKLYCEKTGITFKDLKELRTQRPYVRLEECIGNNIVFETAELQTLLADIRKKVMVPDNNYKYKIKTIFAGIEYNIGVGGLHSVDTPAIFRTDDKFRIVDADVTAFYPNIILNNGFIPEHLGIEYLDLYQQIVSERVDAKALSKDKSQPHDIRQAASIKQAGLKIAINSGFGLMGNQHSWMFDPKALISVTISGQLYLLDLIEKLHLAGIPTISANTDGIVCRIPRDKEDVYYAVCQAWEKRTKFDLEYTDYSRYIRRDVNNYITEKPDGGVKTKGIFNNALGFYAEGSFWDSESYHDYTETGTIADGDDSIIPGFAKGYRSPINTLALYEYFVHGVPVEETIRKGKSIYEYMTTPRVGRDFEVYFEHVENGQIVKDLYQKTNRYVITVGGEGSGSMYKEYKQEHPSAGKKLSMVAGEFAMPLNLVTSENPLDYPIAYQYYIDECYKVIDQIDPPQATLF